MDTQASAVLPSGWVEGLFRRFRTAYGSRVESMWAGVSRDELVETWGAELAPYAAEDFRSALAAMGSVYPDFPPTLYQFRALCRDAATLRGGLAAKVTHVRYGAPDPQVLAEIHRLAESMRDPNRKRDKRDWARTILREDAEGVYRGGAYGVQCAREALGIGAERAAIMGESA